MNFKTTNKKLFVSKRLKKKKYSKYTNKTRHIKLYEKAINVASYNFCEYITEILKL